MGPNPMTRLWRALTRKRSLPGKRGARTERGVAILVVVTTLMVLTVLVTEIAYGARVRFLVAAHERDRVQAYWLSRSGMNLYRLILVGNMQIGDQISGMGVEIPGVGDALWQMVPAINTGLLRMLLGSGGSPDDIDDEALERFRASGEVDEEIAAASREGGLFSDRNFLDFEGDFSAEVVDHESKINVNLFKTDTATNIIESETGKQLHALMSGVENDQWFHERNIDQWEIIGNLKDWVDQDSIRSGGLGGYEDNLYNALDSPYLCKNAPFDTQQEIRLVAGWEGEVYDKFGPMLTIYGKGKININTAEGEVSTTIVNRCATTPPAESTLATCFEVLEEDPFYPNFGESKDFVETLQNSCGIEMDASCVSNLYTDSSKTFTVTSTGLVGTSSVTTTAVVDFSSSKHGKVLYWRSD